VLQEDDQKLLEATLYVHLANDGRILILPGNRLRTQWVGRDELEAELRRIRDLGGLVLYSRENPAEDPSAAVLETFARIVAYKLPMKLVAEPHPDTAEPSS
jgi:hypothetical protein